MTVEKIYENLCERMEAEQDGYKFLGFVQRENG